MPRSHRPRALVGVGMLCLACLAHAQPPADSARSLPLLDVVAARGTGTALVGARAVTLRREDAPRVGASSLAGALERQGGAFVRRYGPGGLASVSLRGASAGQTTVLLDGLRLTDPQLGQLDLSLLPLALLDRAEVVHGAASAWHGADAMGGAVLLSPRQDARGELVLGAHPDGVDGSLALGGGRGRVSLQVAMQGEARTGRFRFRDATQFPAAMVTREGADRRSGALLVRVRAPLASGATTAGAWLAGAARGVPSSAASVGERQDDGLARVWATHTGPLGAGALRVAGWMQAGTLRYRNPRLRLDETARTQTMGLDVDVRRALSATWQARLGASASRATARHPSLAAHATEGLVAVVGDLRLQQGPFAAAFAVRLDRYQRAVPLTPVSPRIGAALALGQGWTWKAATGRSFRAPTLNDRFWQGAGRADLRAEHGWSAETGLHLRRAWGEAEVSAYTSRLRDAIVWQPEGGIWRPSNVQRTATRGLEASVRRNGRAFEGGAFAALTLAEDRSAAGAAAFRRPLRYVPRVTARGDAAVRLPLRGVVLQPGAALQLVGARPVTADASQWLAPYALVRAGLQAARGPVALALHLDNLFDTDYRVVEGYPMPGRQAEARLHITF